MIAIEDQTASRNRPLTHRRRYSFMSNPHDKWIRNAFLVTFGSAQNTRFVVRTRRRHYPSGANSWNALSGEEVIGCASNPIADHLINASAAGRFLTEALRESIVICRLPCRC